MTLPDFLTKTDDEIILSGHRIGLYHVVHYYNDGYSPEMLLGQYPTLPLSLIHKVIAFYLDNRHEIDHYIENCHEQLDVQRSEAAQIDLAALRQRMQSVEQTETSSKS